MAYPSINRDKANALLATYVGAVGARVGEAFLAVGALIWLFTLKKIFKNKNKLIFLYIFYTLSYYYIKLLSPSHHSA